LLAKIITLTSDFGLKDAYPAQMKAAILRISPDAVIVDITHMISKFNIREAAFALASATPYFPDRCVHVAVVDPSVGTQRRPIIVETKRDFLVGPDNGLLILAAERQGVLRVREITNRKLMHAHVSKTFHGRDVFAPAAAHLVNGVNPEEFGHVITDMVKPQFTRFTRGRNFVSGEVLHIDDFGNIITNIPGREFSSFIGSSINVNLLEQKQQMKGLGTYGEAMLNELLVLIGSHGYVEIALNMGNAAEKLEAKLGNKVTFKKTLI
jgi:S-adenosylmethionine hydrolase